MSGLVAAGLLGATLIAGCSLASVQDEAKTSSKRKSDKEDSKLKTATFGAGCYWCVEAVFQRIKGVESVESGFMGGTVENPSYDAVCSGTTGHAEVCQLKYDPEVVSFEELLEVFWKTHDPTTLNRQGGDYGTQYRSAIFYHDDDQKKLADEYKKKLNDKKAFPNPIVTEIAQADVFYKAKDAHQNYYNDNKDAGYCRVVIKPKMDKLEKIFADRLKK